jgi:predicted glycosyltransferase involved in capsule biosynthesis
MFYNKYLKYKLKHDNVINNFSGGSNKNNIYQKYKQYKETRKKIEKLSLNVDTIQDSVLNKIAIIIPYRTNKYQNREEQLNKFIEYYHNYINNLDIYIVEQSEDNRKFNRGALLNIGFDIANKKEYDMYIFHDVDLISPPELKKLYSYVAKYPIQIGNLWREKYTFADFLGGIISFNKDTFVKVNGYPTNFFGWGGEDDSLYNRLVTNDIPVYYPETNEKIEIKEMSHVPTTDIKELTNSNKQNNILSDLKNWRSNGLKQLKYKINDKISMNYENVIKYNVTIL